MEQRRIEWIDQCKAFAIFFMIFFHCGGKMDYTWGALNHLLGPWNMPIFFVLSGIVLNEKKWLGWNNFMQFLKNRTKTLILPFLFWGTICNIWLFVLLNIINWGAEP